MINIKSSFEFIWNAPNELVKLYIQLLQAPLGHDFQKLMKDMRFLVNLIWILITI